MRLRVFLATVALFSVLAGCSKQAPAPASTDSPQPDAPAPQTQQLGDPVPEIVFVTPSEGYDARQFEANRLIAETWDRELGVPVRMETIPDWPAMSSTLAEGSREKIHVFSFGYVSRPSRVDPDELLSRPFMCGADANYGDYCNPALDEVVKASKSEYDVNKRRDLVFQAQELLAQDLPFITVYHPHEPSVYNQQKFDNVVLAVGAGTYNTWSVMDAAPKGDDKTYRFAISNAVRSIHPMLHADFSQDVLFSTLVYDTLTKMAPDGGVVPWLATSWEAVDDTTLRVKLREGHTFHDGKPVTAADVKFSYEYLKTWEIGVYVVNLEPIASITVIDPTTLEFKLTAPSATVLALTMGQVPIIPKHVWEGVVEQNGLNHPKEWTKPSHVGSGPFKYVSHQPGVGVRMERFANHFHDVKVGAFELREFPDARSGFNALLNGTVDFITSDEVGPAEIEEAKQAPHLAVVDQQSITSRFIAFNLREGSPFRDYHFRLAMAHAIDYDTVLSVILQGQALEGAGIIAPGNEFWHNPSVQFPAYDLARAKQVLQDAGYTWDDQGRLHYPKDYTPQVLAK